MFYSEEGDDGSMSESYMAWILSNVCVCVCMPALYS